MSSSPQFSTRRNRVLTAPSVDSLPSEGHSEHHPNMFDSIANNIRYYDSLRRGQPPPVPGAVVRSSSMGSNSSRHRTKSPVLVPVTRVVPVEVPIVVERSSLNHSRGGTVLYPPDLSPEVHEGDNNAAVASPLKRRSENLRVEPVVETVVEEDEAVSPREPFAETSQFGLASPVADPVRQPFKRSEPTHQSQLSGGDLSSTTTRRTVSPPRGPKSAASSGAYSRPQWEAPPAKAVAKSATPLGLQGVQTPASSVASANAATKPSDVVAKANAVAPPHKAPTTDSAAAAESKEAQGKPVVVRTVVIKSGAASKASLNGHINANPKSPLSPASANKEANMTPNERKWYQQFKQTVAVTKQWREHAEALQGERDGLEAEFKKLEANHANLQRKCVDLVRLVADRDKIIDEQKQSNTELREQAEKHSHAAEQSGIYRSQQQTIERLTELLEDQQQRTTTVNHRSDSTERVYPGLDGDTKVSQQLRSQCSLLASQLASATDVQRRYKERASDAEVRFLERQLVEERRRVHELFESLWELSTSSHMGVAAASRPLPNPLPVLFPRGTDALSSGLESTLFGQPVGRGSPQRLNLGSEHHTLNNLYHLQCVDTTENCEDRLAAYFGVVEGIQQTLITARMHQAGAEQASMSIKEVMTEVLDSIQESAKALYKNTKTVNKIRDGMLIQQQLMTRQSRALKSQSKERHEMRLLEPSESPHHRRGLYPPSSGERPPRHTPTTALRPGARTLLDDSFDVGDSSISRNRRKDKRSKKDKKRRHSDITTADLMSAGNNSSTFINDGMESADIALPTPSSRRQVVELVADAGEQYLVDNVTEASGIAKETYDLFMQYTGRIDAATEIMRSCIQGLRAVLRAAPLNQSALVDDSAAISVSDIGSDVHMSPSARKHIPASVLDPTAAPQELLKEIEADIVSFKQSSSDVVARMSAALQRERRNHKQDCDGYLRRLRLAEEEYRSLLVAVSRYLPADVEQDVIDGKWGSSEANPSVMWGNTTWGVAAHTTQTNNYPNYPEETHRAASTRGDRRSVSVDEPRFDSLIPGTPAVAAKVPLVRYSTPTPSSRNTSTHIQPQSAQVERRGSGAFAAKQALGMYHASRGKSLPTTSRASTPLSTHRYFFDTEDLIDDGRAVKVDSGQRQERPRRQVPHPTQYRHHPTSSSMVEVDSLPPSGRHTPLQQQSYEMRAGSDHRTGSTATRGSIPAPDMADDKDGDHHGFVDRRDLTASSVNSERSFLTQDNVREAMDGAPSTSAAMAIHRMLHGQAPHTSALR